MHNWRVYYGNGYDAQAWTRAERAQNADLVASYLSTIGWSIEAISAVLGNMEAESYINPGQWEHSYPVEQVPAVGGFGLVQWTPWTKYSEWAGYAWNQNYDLQLTRIKYELDNNLQWISTQDYPLSFSAFTTATIQNYSIEYLAMAWFKNYERGVGGESARQTNAVYWYQYLQSNPPVPWTPDVKSSHKMKIMFYLKPKWKRL